MNPTEPSKAVTVIGLPSQRDFAAVAAQLIMDIPGCVHHTGDQRRPGGTPSLLTFIGTRTPNEWLLDGQYLNGALVIRVFSEYFSNCRWKVHVHKLYTKERPVNQGNPEDGPLIVVEGEVFIGVGVFIPVTITSDIYHETGEIICGNLFRRM